VSDPASDEDLSGAGFKPADFGGGVLTSGQRPARRRCPTCNAPRSGEPVCHRCRSDLTLLIHLERRADELRVRARHCYARGWYRQAAAVAAEVVSLEATPDDLGFLASANVMCGNFPAAIAAFHKAVAPASCR
jgi:hypothetical protein